MNTAISKPSFVTRIMFFETIIIDKLASWGDKQKVNPSTHVLVVRQNGEIYGIENEVFAKTYKLAISQPAPGCNVYVKLPRKVAWRYGKVGEVIYNHKDQVYEHVRSADDVVIRWEDGEYGVMPYLKFIELYDIDSGDAGTHVGDPGTGTEGAG